MEPSNRRDARPAASDGTVGFRTPAQSEGVSVEEQDMTDKNDDVERIERTDTGASVQVDVTRGTGTRNQEKWRLKGKGENATMALQELKRELKEVFGEPEPGTPLAEQLRNFQPEVEEQND